MSSNKHIADCVVVGGGIIGLMTARELANAGVKVLLVERGEIGRESSWAGGGILFPLDLWQISQSMIEMIFWSQKHYPRLSEELRSSTGIDPELINSGMLILDDREFGPALEWRRHHDYPIEMLRKSDVLTRCPLLGKRAFESALWLRDVLQVRNPRLLKALENHLRAAGVAIRTRSTVTKITVRQGTVHGIEVGKERIASGAVIVATGAWSSTVIAPTLTSINIYPIRGQMLLLRGPVGLVKPIISGQGHYIIPRKDGRILVGSTLENVGFDKTTTAHAFDELKAAAVTLVPKLIDCEIERHWAGLRPGSKDGIPIISDVPGVRGLFINAGHFRNGLLLAPGSAKLMSDIVLGYVPTLNPAPFRLT